MQSAPFCAPLYCHLCPAISVTSFQIIIIIIIIIICYTHMPKPVCEEGDVTVLWNQAVHTDREVTADRPDIIIKNKKEKT